MMSSRMAATVALWDLIKSAANETSRNKEKFVFLPYGKMGKLKISRSAYYKRLKRFEKHSLIKKIPAGTGYVVTDRAKKIRSKPVTKKLRHDGFSTLILFDIPEEKHNARNNFRRYLIRSGYTQIRESCFISPFEIMEDLKDLIGELDIKQDVSVFVVKQNLLTF